MIIEVGGAAFQVTRIYGRDWGISLVIGLLSFPIGALVRLLPSEPFYRFLIRCHIYPDPSKSESLHMEEEEKSVRRHNDKILEA